MAWYHFLACVISTHCLVSGQKYGMYGTVLSLNPGITGGAENMLWKHNGNKVVEFDGKEEEVYSQFKNRVTLDWVSGELNITDLRHDDGGVYKLEVVINKLLKHFDYTVVVIDKISKPTISCDFNESSSVTHGTQARLTCSAGSQSLVTYKWDTDGKTVQGPRLTIPLGEEDDDKTHTCIVTNPLQAEKATFTANDCYPAKTSSVALAAGIPVAIVVLLLALVLLYLFLKKKACFADKTGKDVEASHEDEHKTLIDRTPTIPCTQRLHNLNRGHGNMKTGDSDHSEVEKEEEHVKEQFPEKGFVQDRRRKFEPKAANLKQEESFPPPRAKKPAARPLGKNKDDAEAYELISEPPEIMVPEGEPSDTEMANEPEPAGGLDHKEDTQAEVESPAASEQPEEPCKDNKKCPPPPPKKPERLDPVYQPVNNDAGADESRASPKNKVPEGEPSDTEKANEPEPAGGLDHKEDTRAEVESPAASEQPEEPCKDNKKCPPPPPKKPERLDPVYQPVNNDAGADESRASPENKVPEGEPSDTEKANEPEPAGGLDHKEDTRAEVESPAASEQPEEHLGKDHKKCPPTPPKKPARLDPVRQPVNTNDAEAHESAAPPENMVPECKPSDTEKANEPEPAGGSEHSEDTQAEVESTTTLQRGYVLRMSSRFDKNRAGNKKENAEKDESTGPSENTVPECEPSDTEKANEPDTQADVESSTAPQPPGYVGRVTGRFCEQSESDHSHPANGAPPVPKPRLRPTSDSDDTAGEHK